ncbi:hypothetical protein [Dactylosporangium sp. NPDC050588]|uniref:hypothetical protein n=1 Tax=Dactylosporangium sp. NPDC050588 TaxID=3157211 RepID=UPI003410D90E
MSDEPKRRFLVVHDYGMGGLWWWIHARSVRQIVETFAEVEVVEDPQIVARFANEDLTEVDVDIDAAAMPPGLDDLREQRDAQRSQHGFGALAGQGIVYLRRPPEEGDGTELSACFVELGPDGRRLRQVEMYRDATAIKTGPDDWPLNPPIDLYDPELAGWQVTPDQFEQAWCQARSES